LWFHVDAAYGGPAARTSVAGPLFQGLAQADSIVVNAHKWLYVPVEASCILVRQPSALRDTFRIVADYLQGENDKTSDGPIDFKDYGPQLSRSFRALKVWMTFKAYGALKLRAAIESNIAVMRYLADRIDASSDFVRLAPVPFVGGLFSVPHLGCLPSRRSGLPGQVERRAGGRAGARRTCVPLRDEDSRKDGAPGVQRQSPAATVRRGLLVGCDPGGRG
jgi:Pyridoxal-dependent decarboxylase conserved domain